MSDVGEIDLDLSPGDCWKCDVREATTRLGLCDRCDHELRPQRQLRESGRGAAK